MAENDQKDKIVEKVTGEVENTDKKEKWRHILIYNFKVYLVKRSASFVTDRRV